MGWGGVFLEACSGWLECVCEGVKWDETESEKTAEGDQALGGREG